MESSSRKVSRSLGGIASTAALMCSLGLPPQQAGAAVVLTGCGGVDFGSNCSLAELANGGSILINVQNIPDSGYGLG